MLAATYPIRILLMTLTGLVNGHQGDVIAYLVEENHIRNLGGHPKSGQSRSPQNRPVGEARSGVHHASLVSAFKSFWR